MFGHNTESQNKTFLAQKKIAREERELEKKREWASVRMQAIIRGFLIRKRYRRRILEEFDEIFKAHESTEITEMKSINHSYSVARRFLIHFSSAITTENEGEFRERFEHLCRSINKSMESESLNQCYAAICLQEANSLAWIAHIKLLLLNCCKILENIKPENHAENTALTLYLHTLVVFTSPKTWGILRKKQCEKLIPAMQKICYNIQGDLVQNGRFFQVMRAILLKATAREELTVRPVLLKAILTLCTRPLSDSDFSRKLLAQFFVEIMSVPALIYQLNANAPQCIEHLNSLCILKRAVNISQDATWFKDFGEKLSDTKALAFLGNLVNLFYISDVAEANTLSYPLFVDTTTILLERIPFRTTTKDVFSQWHDLLGWHTPSSDPAQNQNVNLIKRQFNLLWSRRSIKLLLGDLLESINANFIRIEFHPINQSSSNNIIRRALERRSMHENLNKSFKWRRLDSVQIIQVSRTCAMFYSLLNTLSQMKLDILTGVCYNNNVQSIIYNLWLLLTSLGPACGLKEFLETIKNQDNELSKSHTSMLMLFCDCMTHYITLLDEQEMYTEQNPFLLNDYVMLTYFLNNLLYKLINDNIIGSTASTTATTNATTNITESPVFNSLHTLLLCLYRRDCQRQFTSTGHWLIPEVKPSALIYDFEKGKRHALILLQKMPHIISHEDRVKLFRKFVQNEKSVMGLTENACTSTRSAVIVVHRERIVEDGYRQLAALRPSALKGTIRVRFINQQGLHEAGIDQDGVFKEFLEETIKRVFDPSLNLFKTTADQRLYPSPISYVQENHLQLFEFVGRMLGKAVYEGIVVDVPFASFFLSQLLGQTHQALYSCVDELPSFDNELYRSLTFIKHYKDDVANLNLTFSVDQDVMGKIVSHELHPGGRARVVTDHNKLIYIHYMAYFHMNTQIREQTQAFNRGFRSIVNAEWLTLFSPPELQRLISGDTLPLDLRDLRKHTQYYGGFHDSHRVVSWLWDILAKDFTEEERRLFLKFVTSCSKPPLLGFVHLEPPFSIRCVEVGDDEDTGDTIGSVFRGFFTIRKKDPLNRLPTSSTCFNLLKLPNYHKKSTLRDKLRYAISSNTGFELS